MIRVPYMKFFPSDFLVDVQTLTLEERGAWITLICHIWLHSSDGTLDLTNNELGTLLNRTPFKASALVERLASQKIFGGIPLRDTGWKIHARRIEKEKGALTKNAERQRRYYDKNANSDANLTPTSRTSNSDVTHKKSEVRSQKKEKQAKERVPGGTQFHKPTLEEIQAYCTERNNSVDPERWLSHYEANGWKVGRNAMKDWRAAIRTWEKSEFSTKEVPTWKDGMLAEIQAKTKSALS